MLNEASQTLIQRSCCNSLQKKEGKRLKQACPQFGPNLLNSKIEECQSIKM